MFIAIFTIAKVWKPPKCPPMDEWIKKKCCMDTMNYVSAIRKTGILPSATTGMDLVGLC